MTKQLFFLATLTICLFACEQKSLTVSSNVSTSTRATYAYVNLDTIRMNYNYLTGLVQTLQDEQMRYEQEGRAKGRRLQQRMQNYQTKINNGGYLTQERAQKDGEELQTAQIEFQNWTADIQRTLSEKQLELETEFAEILKECLTEYAEEKGFSMVLSGTTLGGPVLYSSSELDVTQDIVQILNTDYNRD